MLVGFEARHNARGFFGCTNSCVYLSKVSGIKEIGLNAKDIFDHREGPPQKTHVMELELRGRFAISTLDNLVVVHHQTSQTSLLFDICLGSFKTDGSVSVHTALVPPYSIRPFRMKSSDEEKAIELCM